LYNLSKRMEMIGGRFTIVSSPGQGTVITLKLPSRI
jgi:signal transduction histidine kinase